MGQNSSGQLSMVDGVGIYIEMTKNTFTAEEFVEGQVYVKCQKPIQISSLSINFLCQEKVNFITYRHEQGNSQSYNTSTVEMSPYENQFEIDSFSKNEMYQGNLIFPFKFLPPSQLPGSIFINPQNFLRYMIFAQIQVSGTKQPINSNQAFIHLTEPIRSQIQPINQSVTNYPQCLDCCESYGTVYTKISCDTNFIKSGQIVKINAEIDNTHGRVPVRNARVSLNFNVCKSSLGQNESYVIQQFQIARFNQIKNGTKSQISVTEKIPTSFYQQSTAFGTIIAAYHTLEIQSQMGILSRGANICVPVVFITENPNVQKSFKLKAKSAFSSPKKFPMFTFANMKNYIHKPVEGIPKMKKTNANSQGNLLLMNKSYTEQKMNQEDRQQIRKKSSVQHNAKQENMQKDRVDSESINKNKKKTVQNQRQKKYMDEQNQNDYNQFKDFKQNQPNSWSKIIGNFLHPQF